MRTMNYQEALKIVIKNINNDEEIRRGYIANIAMAFKDEYNRTGKKYKNQGDVHSIANKAAINFLNSLCA